MTNVIERVNKYIAKQKREVNETYRLNYHIMPPCGWMNDPNGLIRFGGKYHLYYQFNPFDTRTGTMYWGHVISDDLISYEDAGVAIAPQEEYESIFSGGAIEVDGGIIAMYTLHFEQDDFRKEEVYKAVSADGQRFTDGICVFDNCRLPANLSRTDFRDPCPAKIGDKYYVFLGGKDILLNRGVIIVLGGYTLDRLEYEFYIGPYHELGDMGECPSYFRIGEKDVFVVSGCHVNERDNDFMNINASVFIVGNLDVENGRMAVDFIKEIDKGDTFYAPQFVRGIDEPVMIGWLEMWNKPYPTRDMEHGWVGAFSIPRKIEYRDGDVFQHPVDQLQNYLCEIESGEVPASSEIKFRFEGEGSLQIEGSNGKVVITNNGNVCLDTRLTNNSYGSIRRTNGTYQSCNVQVLLDTSSIEIFVDDGRETISSRIYLDGKYHILSEGKISNLKINEIRRKV